MGKKLLKVLFWILIIGLLVLPLGLIYQISELEMAEYEAQESPKIQQVSIGTPVQASRTDVDLCVTVSGTFTCTEVAFMELTYDMPYEIRWIVSYGDEIQVGQVLGYYDGEEVISTVDGTISNINTSVSKPYLMVNCYAPLVLECRVQDTTLSSLEQFADSLTLTDGTAVTIEYISKVRNSDGTTTVRLSLDREGDDYGTTEESLTIYLGVSYPQVLTLPLSCVYQKTEGEDEPWYVRQVTEDGFLIAERQITVSYTNNLNAIVSGVEEGQWFDSGYKTVINGD